MIKLNGISRTYNQGTEEAVRALSNVDLDVDYGETVAVMGVSGSGKSTLLHIIGCLDKPDEGSYELEGEDISRKLSDTLSRIRNEKIGFVLQDYGLISDKTVLENIMFPLAFSRKISYKEMKRRAENTAGRIGITALSKKRVSELSGGQQQRAAIARAIVNEPDLILADEPTAALDHKTADEIMDVLLSLAEDKKHSVIIVTHDKRIADMCDRTVYIADGEITESET
ncbi:MAG: ABC transporter ATP-binding protein [Ruminococcus sp.]|nr:ABC transporter ATP-binding protein [Ruminococcus sp.]